MVGMVCYYGKHYSTFFFQTKIRKWMYFDDAHVKEVRRSLERARRNTGRGVCVWCVCVLYSSCCSSSCCSSEQR